MARSKYFAYFVDLQGTARASYELQAANDNAAKIEARYFLKFHPSVEVWQGARWVARAVRNLRGSGDIESVGPVPIDRQLACTALPSPPPKRQGRAFCATRAMDEERKIEHQIDLATRTAGLASDRTTVQRFRKFADDLRERLRQMLRHRKVRSRAYELWEEAGRPPHRDLEFWLEAERQTKEDRRQD